MQKRRPVMLVVLDGWGWRDEAADNAVRQAQHAHLRPAVGQLPARASCARRARTSACRRDRWAIPRSAISTSAPAGVVMQDLPRIGDAIAQRRDRAGAGAAGLIDALQQSGGTCHLIGLVSPGGVHSHQDHAAALAKILADAGVPTVAHAFTDGRDTPPQSAGDDLEAFLAALPQSVPVATVIGRYYAMDRDKRWERVVKAYRAIVEAEGPRFADARGGDRRRLCARSTFDEFIVPAVIGDYRGMRDGDGVLCFNFRADRVREILGAMLDPDFAGFPAQAHHQFAAAVGMTQYSEHLDKLMQTIFPPQTLAEHPRRGRRRRRPHATAHGGDREISARHLFPQRRRARSPIPARIASWCRRPRSRPTTCSPRCRRPN